MTRLAACLLCFAAGFVTAQSPLTWPPTHGEVLILPLRVIDGDTVEFAFLVKERARLYGINTPEKNTEGGKASKAFLESKIPKGPTKAVLLGREKYGRLLVDIFAGDESLSRLIIDSGHGKPYFGKGPKPI